MPILNPDAFVKVLGAIYFALSVNGEYSGDSMRWRVKKLGVKERVCAALEACAGDDHLMPASSLHS
jgi:hypothetical protein